jgi:hypothetical protein
MLEAGMAKSKKKKLALPPRRKRMNRADRLQSAKKWLASFTGKNVVRGYAKWFGVDLLCAAKELQPLGVPIDPVYLKRLETTVSNRRRQTPQPPRDLQQDFGESDEHFSFIAGYTSGGMPYGVPWPDDELDL